jgi:hypothetical protein
MTSITDYFGSLLNILCQWWLREGSIPKRRDNLVRKLIKSGGNILHIDRYGRTPLQNLVWNSFGGNCATITSQWLELLRSCEVDVAEYLREELHLNINEFELLRHGHSMTYDCIRPRKIDISLHSARNPSLVITRWVNPESSATILLREFDFCPDIVIKRGMLCCKTKSLLDVWRNDHQKRPYDEGRKSIFELLVEWRQNQKMQQGQPVDWSDSDSDEKLDCHWTEMPDYLDAKQMKAMARIITEHPGRLCKCDAYGNYIDLWPFHGGTHTLCQSGNMLTESCLRPNFGQYNNWCEVHSCRFNHARFKRKQAKKMAKQMRIRGVQPAKAVLPGAWID